MAATDRASELGAFSLRRSDLPQRRDKSHMIGSSEPTGQRAGEPKEASMHAVVVRVNIKDSGAEDELRNEVVPRASQAPGFVAGYWTRSGNQGLSMIVFDSEDAARQMADRIPQTVPKGVEFEHAEVREVVASA
jgi:hypothetical protein